MDWIQMIDWKMTGDWEKVKSLKKPKGGTKQAKIANSVRDAGLVVS